MRRSYQGGSQFASIPPVSGLYAWYYRPLVRDPAAIGQSLAQLLRAPGRFNLDITHRYGLHLCADGALEVEYGGERESPTAVVDAALSVAPELVFSFLSSETLVLFTRPIYIGIAVDLYERVYVQHYQLMDQLWQDQSDVSRFLSAYPGADVEAVTRQLGVPHSFALEARVRGLPLRDLLVHIWAMESLSGFDATSTQDTGSGKPREVLEKLLHLLADPVCGRR